MNETKTNKKRLIPDIITPNRITYVRLILIPVFIAFFYLENISYNFVISAVIFAVASLTDFLDGAIARKYNLVSNMGKFLDPIADKVLVSTAFILMLTNSTLLSVFPYENIIAGICISIIMARELIISGFRQVAATTGLVMAAEKLGKYKTACQDFSILILLVSMDLLEFSYGIYVFYVGAGLFVLATILTVWSGISYIVKNKQVLKG